MRFKCYRTEPKTLMFAQALGMGLFEDNKLWWLSKEPVSYTHLFAKGAGKVIPLIGAPISAALTYWTFKPMASKLKKQLDNNLE